MWYWDEVYNRYMMCGYNYETNELERFGYFRGEWVSLSEKEIGIDGETGTAYYFFVPSGEAITYLTSFDLENPVNTFYDIKPVTQDQQPVDEQPAEEQPAQEQPEQGQPTEQSEGNSNPVSSARDLNYGDDWRSGI